MQSHTSCSRAAADLVTPAKNGAALAAMIPGARSVFIPNCGHMIPSEAPDALLDALIEAFGARSKIDLA